MSGENLTFNDTSLIIFRTHSTWEYFSASLTARLTRHPTVVLSSLYGSKSDLKASLELLSEARSGFLDLLDLVLTPIHLKMQGAVVPVVSAEPLENVNKVLDDLRAARVIGRKVIVPSLGHH